MKGSEEIQVAPELGHTMSTIDYNSKGGTQLESEAEKVDSINQADVGGAVPVEHGGLTQYELANDPHRYVIRLVFQEDGNKP